MPSSFFFFFPPPPPPVYNPPLPPSGDQPTTRASKAKQKTRGDQRIELGNGKSQPIVPFHSIPSLGMDKVLAFSILSASPADIAAGTAAFPTTRLSWRRGAGGGQQGDSAEAARQRQRDGEKQGGSPSPHGHGQRGGGKDEPPAAFLPRFAPEFDGIDCFETIVSH